MATFSVLDHLAEAATAPAQLYLDGQWVDGAGGSVPHLHPATGEKTIDVPLGDVAQMEAAIAAARRAFDEGPWPTLPGRERAAALRRIAAAVRADVDNLRVLLSLDSATPQSFAGYYQMGAEYAADLFDVYAGWVDKLTGETFPQWEPTQPFMYTTHEPVGVVGVITPWNAPITLLAQKLAPALAAGCTVVAKPSELAPFTTLRLAELIASCDLPPGTFNLVPGPGDPVGTALVRDPRVDKVTFTGSRAVGGAIAAEVGARVGRVTLELGGKSPAIIFPDADLGAAVGYAAGNTFLGVSGQACVCQSRILVHRDVADDVVEHLVGFTAFATYGDPFDPGVSASPMVSEAHLARVMDHIERAAADGATVAAGGGRPEAAPEGGYYVAPTVITDVDNRSAIARDEVFGPVVCVIPFDDEDHAVRLANDTDYGLAAAVYTSDLSRALRLSRSLRAGNVGVNTWTLQPHAPFGGMKQSGVGRENGEDGIRAFLETKTVFLS